MKNTIYAVVIAVCILGAVVVFLSRRGKSGVSPCGPPLATTGFRAKARRFRARAPLWRGAAQACKGAPSH